MSNSYIVELERLRAMLRDILDNKGIEVETDEPLNSLVPKVNAVGLGELVALCAGTLVDINDTEGDITTVNNQLFRYANSVRKVNLPECTSLATCALYGCTSLTEANLPKVNTIGQEAFRKCTALQKITLGETTSVSMPQNTFNGCSSLQEFRANILSLSYADFLGCASLRTFKCNQIESMVMHSQFQGDSNLELIDIGRCNGLTASAGGGTNYAGLTNCGNLKALVIRGTINGNAVPTLSNSQIFTTWQTVNNPDFSIFIPYEAADAYQNAAQWSNFISDYYLEIQLNLKYLIPLGFDYEEYVEIVESLPASPTKWKVYWIEKSRTATDVTYAQWFADDDGKGGIYVRDIDDNITIPLEVV